ncbi:2-dehydropantoate 2-reductase [Bradyrhizobium sp. Tv2a-2]|uniref:2-dehydropantoate 2-reductase n=1 Tax=Bradyrhizobium sp. Tv2a-2 TaxID=113395 RepID=UPI00040D8099|nr:2-dehydropantoate 2-reductase [Bradyrhizobium sp. Tv2a-2]
MSPTVANSERQRVAVIGLGSIGGVVAGLLGAASRHDVAACVRRPIEQLTVEQADGAVEFPIRGWTDPSMAQPQDWVLLCTKAQDTTASAPWLQRLCGPATRIAVLQNGIGQAERVAPLVSTATVIPTIVYYNSERLAPDRVRYRRAGEFDFAVADDAPGQAFAALFEGTPLRTLVSGDFKTLVWRKLLVNAVANPVSALTIQRNAVFRRADINALCLALLEEAAAVGRADGAKLADDEAAQSLARLVAIPPDAGSSMYFDRLAGRPLEIDALTGAVVEIAVRHRVPTPLLSMLLTLARAASGSSRPGEGRG